VFDALKFEVWDGSNDEFIERSLKVIHAIGQKLDNGNLDWEDHTSPFAQYILTTSTECTRRLHDSKIQHVLGSGKLLHAVASSSSFGFYLVIKNVLPKLDVIWNDLKSKDKKIALLSVFNDILQARLDLRDGLNIALSQGHGLERYSASSEARLTTALAGYQQLMVEDVLINAMMETDSGEHAIDTPYKVNAIKGLVVGARIPGFLSDYHKGTVILEFSKLAANKSQSDEIHAELVKALQQISIEDVTRFRDLTLPTFTAELPDLLRSSKAEFTEQMNNSIFILESLTEIACTAACKVELSKPAARRGTSFKFRVFEEFQEALLKKFDAVLQIPNQLYYANAILAAVYRGLQLFDDVLEKDEAGGDFQPSPLPAIRSLQLIEDVSEKEDSNDVQSSRVPEVGPYDWIIIGLYQKLVCQKAHQSGPLAKLHHMGLKVNLQDPKDSDLFVGLLGRITTLILRSSQTTPMNNFLFNNEKEGQPSQIWYIFCVEPPTESIEISQQNLEFGPAEKGLMNVLSMSLVAGIRRDVSFA
jgi:DNA repair/transcription protein MET18/MMS19